ncbi:MAG: hypothetical protein ACREIH_04955 [Nitrospiraceae bacterium]
MRNLVIGFVLGLLVPAGASVWAQSNSGSMLSSPGTGITTFQDSSGVTGSIYSSPNTGISTNQDSTGRTGSILSLPGSGITTYQFSGGKPC